MRKFLFMLLSAFLGFPIVAVAQNKAEWLPVQTGFIEQTTCRAELNSKTISMPLNHQDVEVGRFIFHYFLHENMDPTLPTLLYIDGGPGGIISPARNPTMAFSKSGFNVVYFHIRGAGCSQLPYERSFDKYINIQNTLEDIEALRRELQLNQWDIVVGESFGAWLATKYSSGYPGSMKKILIDGLYNPIWRKQMGPNQMDALTADIFSELIIRLANRGDLISSEVSSLINQSQNKIRDVFLETKKASIDGQVDMTRMALMPWTAEEVMASSKLKQIDGWKDIGPEIFLTIYLISYPGALDYAATLVERQRAILTVVAQRLFPNNVTANQLKVARENLLIGLATAKVDSRFLPVSYRVVADMFPEVNAETSSSPWNTPTVIISGSLDIATHQLGAKIRAQSYCRGNCLWIAVDGGGHSIGSSLPTQIYPRILRALHIDSLSAVGRLLENESDLKGLSIESL